MKKIIIIFLFMCLLIDSASARPTAKITIKAVDELGTSIDGADVSVSFSVPNKTGIGLASIKRKGITNYKGLFIISNETIGRIGFSLDKEGYYQSGAGYEFTSSSRLFNRWQPWNPMVEVVLKKKRNPVPMYMKYTDSMKMPEIGKPIGYDLEKGDWVAPHGIGVVSDLIFTFTSIDRAWTDYECGFTLAFSNEKDGIQEYSFKKNDQSYYKWPFEAPESDYKKTIKKYKSDLPGKGPKTNEKKDINYIFRVRTKTDIEGNIVEAKYGKIKGEINVWPGKIKFYYFFNPDGTRNLEENPDQNLFKKE